MTATGKGITIVTLAIRIGTGIAETVITMAGTLGTGVSAVALRPEAEGTLRSIDAEGAILVVHLGAVVLPVLVGILTLLRRPRHVGKFFGSSSF